MAVKTTLVFLSLSLLLYHITAEVTLETIRPGDATNYPQNGWTVLLHYIGELENGTVFDSSLGRKPFSFIIGHQEVIPGLEEGVKQMSKDQYARLTITPDLAFGEGVPHVIPPNETVVFEVHLIGIWKAALHLYVDDFLIHKKPEA